MSNVIVACRTIFFKSMNLKGQLAVVCRPLHPYLRFCSAFLWFGKRSWNEIYVVR